MKLLLSISVIFLFGAFNVAAQSKLIAPYIEAWSASDTSQTHKAEKTYYALKTFKDSPKYRQVLNELNAYVENNYTDRLKTRILMFEVLGNGSVGYVLDRRILEQKVKIALKLASKLKDQQLLAEIYALAGQIDLDGGFFIYNLKSYELQQKIGVQHFSFVHNRLLNISTSLYQTGDYRQSVNYGLACLKFKNIDTAHWDPRVYIFQLDIIGAAYKQLKLYDSAKYYYQQIIDTLKKKPDVDYVQDLWMGIAKGNIGHLLSLQGNYQQAIPLINIHLQNSNKLSYWDNAAMAQNNLAEIYFKQNKYDKALTGFRQAYKWALISNRLKEQIKASKALSSLYRLKKQDDSAFKYNELFHKHKDTLATYISSSKLSAVKAKIAYDNIQENLNNAENIITEQRLTRNFILIATLLLIVIALLFYNRKMLQQKHLAAELRQKHQLATREVIQAKELISNFTKSIVEKEQLIDSLQEQLEADNKQINQSLLQYTLITDEEWVKFRSEFSKAYPRFLPSLHKLLTNITPAEERLASLLCLNLTSNQIANTLGISKDSVGRSKRRLKNRLNLDVGNNLESFICKLV